MWALWLGGCDGGVEHPLIFQGTPWRERLGLARSAGVSWPSTWSRFLRFLPGSTLNRFNSEVLIPELRAAKKTFDVHSHAGQGHCFCATSGVPRPSGGPTAATAPAAALEAYQQIEGFYRKYLPLKARKMEARLVTQVPVRTNW